MKITIKDIGIIVLAVIIAGAYWHYTAALDDAYRAQLRLINERIEYLDSLNDDVSDKIRQLEMTMRRQNARIRHFTYKLREYERKTDYNRVDRLDRDSLRAILTR